MVCWRAGLGTAWLFPFVDGQPQIGWDEASRYLLLPVLLVVAQFLSSAIISPPVDPNDDGAKTTKLLVSFLPLMIGWFALNVPSGLSLYYFSNTVVTSAQQIWLRKLGGARITAMPRSVLSRRYCPTWLDGFACMQVPNWMSSIWDPSTPAKRGEQARRRCWSRSKLRKRGC